MLHILRTQLTEEVKRLIIAPSSDSADAFDDLALRLCRYQLINNEFYRAYCDARGIIQPEHWTDIPAIPTTAFKRTAIRSFPEQETLTYFQTSGTTEGESGRHYFQTLDVYKAAILPNFKAHLMPDHDRMQMLILTANPIQAPHSSLTYMMEFARREFGAPNSAYFMCEALNLDGLRQTLEQTAGLREPVFLLGTAFAFVHVLDTLRESGTSFQLPPGSRIMETGGFKGRSREVPRAELYEMLVQQLGIAPHCIVNEYGMTELSSQFYDTSIVEGRSTEWKSIPHWTRIQIVDPLEGKPVPDGEQGLIHVYDLANVGSVLAIATEDIGVKNGDRFRVIGRVQQAQPRGCSLAVNV